MKEDVKFQFICFGFGQAIMMLNVASGILSKYLTLENASLPTLQSTCLYVVLGAVYITVRYVRKTPLLGLPWWFYLILAFVDVEGNYFAVKAFNYANYATLSLILNMTVPFVSLFCYLFLKTRYSTRHYLGATIALSGSIVIFVTDYTSSANGTSSREIRGDMYALIAAAFYATSNVMIQAVVKTRNVSSNIEVLGFLGFWASIVSIIQVLILELDSIQSVVFTGRVYGYMTGYVGVLFVFYTVSSVFLRWAESLMFNLSLLTGPIFTVAISYLIFDESVNKWYWLALTLVYIGLICYSTAPAPKEIPNSSDKKSSTGDYGEQSTPDTTCFA
ncbi:drug metabolite transporter superfamily [Plasmopara halstedii]|uniref:Drug metabolite transporter superfamily n=1 Tax=Plasmopara halstedii TaxID=4781 RepID=A0A0P1AA81_PLAHL|nr:drug metabolite transporter superfamily [Plasmopara halstedii]CEG37301.1 drug metabolite transporter superfamily [Plasmopara halstedii]|eukprot:XP_024573670.1 drug metabolite transporter superfamily [Plasmopara halstedii]